MSDIPTTERLARALEELNDPALAEMIKRAREGYYDDFKTPLAFPLHQLVADLRAAGHPDIVQRVIDGEFDCTKEEAQEWFEREGADLFFKSLLSDAVKPDVDLSKPNKYQGPPRLRD